jgi:hypothetical protein
MTVLANGMPAADGLAVVTELARRFGLADVVLVSEWRPEGDAPRPLAAEVSCYGGVGHKP